MRRLLSVITACTLLLSGTNGAPAGDRKLNRRQEDALLVDLDYARYRGYIDNSTGLDVWKGCEKFPPCKRTPIDKTTAFDMPLLQYLSTAGKHHRTLQ